MIFKTITTKHPEIGYVNNIEIIEAALREQFMLDDSSYVLRAVASHIWSMVCGGCGDERQWGEAEVRTAISMCQARLEKMVQQLR